MDTECVPSVRPLYAWEIQEARLVFADQLNFDRVRVHECAKWPNTINRIGSWLKKMPYTGAPNAITLGNHCYFPIKILRNFVPPDHREHYKICWLIHELTHCWQYQNLGWRYLIMALGAQIREGDKAYDFGGESGLIKHFQDGKDISKFNLEQQGDIARDYYLRICKGKNTTAWDPFIKQIKNIS